MIVILLHLIGAADTLKESVGLIEKWNKKKYEK